ncbi:response regulator transcription factor [Aquincola sp. S2]|uniref:Response regulator transcription factor n=1 Tax=Pseudaquabacterium terrae TaxID=2732868 RepID=A0ABX2EB19_9BURK|nr:response regulator transcription factor [Aquabacterium terrae]NRF66305.1 response regulator transcription factor [Aquabacterium terrae]
MTRCLLVDDDAAIRTLLVDFLQQHGISVEALADGASFRRCAVDAEVDLLLLDLMLPDDDGLALCRWIKQRRPALPVIMLTAQGDPISRVLGLEIGADDYLPKPFEPRELVARIRAVLRRGRAVAAAAGTELQFAGWRFDRLERQLHAPDGLLVALSAAEFRLLSAFVEHAGQVLTRERLLELTRSPGTEAAGRSIDLAVSRLRGKLAVTGTPLIRTLRGEGYLFDGTVSAA